ncbi:ABC transporter substrate-binding protein [Labrenzia sp. PHM005]|uniref:substrate-binding periplasmic protein n=1 Tax=Labrenzia sp. PHM005 TaxID=2590016 RepID=UPI00113FF393|nr:transporter substrate-binding domain-containing protein [Labrenzia sp. PHM005]QDG77666.1 amino acid ABC transporter substrate-binding protein [Labrenzia sp. PHM005]
MWNKLRPITPAIQAGLFIGGMLITSGVQATEVTTVYQDSFPKYIDSGDKVSGLCIELIHAVEKKLGDVTFVGKPSGDQFRPLKRIEVEVANGTIDVFFCMAKNSRRADLFDYIRTPLYEVNHVVAVRKGEHQNIKEFGDIRRLGNVSILTNFGSATARFLSKQGGLNVDSSGQTLDQNLKKLIVGRGEFVYFHDIGLYSTIREKFKDEPLEVLPARFHSYHHYLVISKKAPVGLRDRLESAIADLHNDGTLESIVQKYKTAKTVAGGG